MIARVFAHAARNMGLYLRTSALCLKAATQALHPRTTHQRFDLRDAVPPFLAIASATSNTLYEPTSSMCARVCMCVWVCARIFVKYRAASCHRPSTMLASSATSAHVKRKPLPKHKTHTHMHTAPHTAQTIHTHKLANDRHRFPDQHNCTKAHADAQAELARQAQKQEVQQRQVKVSKASICFKHVCVHWVAA